MVVTLISVLVVYLLLFVGVPIAIRFAPIGLSYLRPEPLLIECPHCNTPHIDRGIWARKRHRTHQCIACGNQWRPSRLYSIGVSYHPSLFFARLSPDGLGPLRMQGPIDSAYPHEIMVSDDKPIDDPT